jgi:hypothetical protein
MPLRPFAGHRPGARALARIRPTVLETRPDLPRSTSPSTIPMSLRRLPARRLGPFERTALTSPDRPPRPNPHRLRATPGASSPRVRSLAACRRRPQCTPRHSRPAGVRNPSQVATLHRFATLHSYCLPDHLAAMSAAEGEAAETAGKRTYAARRAGLRLMTRCRCPVPSTAATTDGWPGGPFAGRV